MPSSSQPPPNRGRPRGSSSFAWRSFFEQTTTPLFVLGKNRRLRYANAAWEKLTGLSREEAFGMVCSARKRSSPLPAALAPSPAALAGQVDTSRRPAAPHRNGPPWWDITFVPLRTIDGLFGIVGIITVVGDAVVAAAKKIPPQVVALREECTKYYNFDLLTGESMAAERLVAQARLAASLTAPVWLVGEPGSGKETTARVIHAHSPWRERAFVAIDCLGLQPYLIEGLLFGHGGLAPADRVGTIYLKEPSALPRDLQQRLADEFADRVQPRLICGSRSSAAHAVAAGTLVPMFQSVYSAFEIHVPPLREQLDDLPRIAARYLPHRPLDPAALAVLRMHPWPGQLREFRTVLREAAAAAPNGPILREHLPLALRLRAEAVRLPPSKTLSLDRILQAVERRLIEFALQKTQGNQTEAAELLGIFRTRLHRRLEALGITSPPNSSLRKHEQRKNDEG
ncbi:MAG: sigma 54-interacting transcriptional regulator [Gemmataceae bacterium]|nr:sigma 54-interacting transcriptional regulator [Gemmataceae bacterium]